MSLICKIRDHVITEDGDLVLSGTPCKVLGLSDDGNKVEVRASAYVHTEAWTCREWSEDREDRPATDEDLMIKVHPGNLVFNSFG